MSFSALLLWALAQPTAMQGNLAVPPNRWTIDYGRESCTLARRVGDERSTIVALNARLGSAPGEFLVLDGGSGLDGRLRGELRIRVDEGVPIVLRGRRDRRNGLPLVTFSPMPDDFLDRLADARRIAVESDGEVVLSLSLPGAREAVEELSRCNEDLLQSWGIDVAARRALSRLPRLRDPDWASSIMPSASTYLVFAAEVSERGRPIACRIVVSSRNPRMDRAVCNLVRSRARFEPAMGAEGQPVPAQYVTRIRWIIDEPGQ